MQAGFNPVRHLMGAMERVWQRFSQDEKKMNEIASKLNVVMQHLDGSTIIHERDRTTTFTAEPVDLINDGAEAER